MKVLLSFVAPALALNICGAFTPISRTHSPTALQMGLFDGFKKAFSNAEYAAPAEGIKASARHILVKSQDDANIVMDKLASGANFASLASEYSSCPSGSRGGSLGSFSPGTMVPAFDTVIFSSETNIGEVVGPVKTDFGYHLIVVDKRTGI
jgi:peptidyl-prolyl cis-trans isomerase C